MKKKKEKQLITLTAHFKGAIGDSCDRKTAINLLGLVGLSLTDSARVCIALAEALNNEWSWSRVRQVIQLGSTALIESERSISFQAAVDLTLQCKANRSPRTLQDIRQTMRALMQSEEGLADKSIRLISSRDWTRILQKAYAHSPSRFIKARANLSGVYSTAFKHGFCDHNPVKRVDIPSVQEREIQPLSLDEIASLLKTAQHPTHRSCLPALGLMLYAGVRPEEVTRICWEDLDWEEQVLYMAPRHTKTGGYRQIPLSRCLMRLLRKERGLGSICPEQWKKKWQYLRQAAGFMTWVPDVLRHSFASYHAKMYQNLPLLQLSMGHRDSRLLQTRYINLRGIRRKDAKAFWDGTGLRMPSTNDRPTPQRGEAAI
ncbi:MAG: tyrosine-type recombinase/integrase [Akkermansia sp.]